MAQKGVMWYLGNIEVLTPWCTQRLDELLVALLECARLCAVRLTLET